MAQGVLKKVYFIPEGDGGWQVNDDPPQYIYKAYPKVKYHATKDPVVINNETEEAQAGKEWSDKPVRKQDGDTREDGHVRKF